MRSFIIVAFLLMLSACDSSTDPGAPVEPTPTDVIPYARPWPTAAQAVVAKCSALCRWDVRCDASVDFAVCESACYEDACTGVDCSQPPSGTDEQLALCVHYVWLEVNSPTPRCEIPRTYSNLCTSATLPD